MAKQFESATVFIDEAPWGGYTVSSLKYLHDSTDAEDEYADEQPEDSDNHGDFDTKSEAVAAAKEVAKGMLEDTESVTVLFDGGEIAVCGSTKKGRAVCKKSRTGFKGFRGFGVTEKGSHPDQTGPRISRAVAKLAKRMFPSFQSIRMNSYPSWETGQKVWPKVISLSVYLWNGNTVRANVEDGKVTFFFLRDGQRVSETFPLGL